MWTLLLLKTREAIPWLLVRKTNALMPLRLILDEALGWGTDPSTEKILERKSGELFIKKVQTLPEAEYKYRVLCAEQVLASPT